MSFGFAFIATAFWLASVSGTSDYEDARDGYLFLLHGNNDLVLVIRNNTCYYVAIAELKMGSLYSSNFTEIEDEIVKMLSGTTQAYVTQSSAGALHRKFRDESADILCQGRVLYDVTISVPPVPVKTVDIIGCDFQTDTCGWTVSGQWSWTLHKGPSGKPNTGPLADHNRDVTQYYVYADGSSAASPSSKARLTSPVVGSSTYMCLQFYYHMYGSGEGTLTLNVKTQAVPEHTEWQRSGDQGDTWHKAQITLLPGVFPCSLVFEAIKGINTFTDIAIDDVSATNDVCPPDPSDMGCDFELLTLCTWRQGSKDNLDWDLQMASAGGQNGGPSVDHTLQTGRGLYISLSSRGQVQGQEAALESRTLPRITAYCLSLWYYIPSPNSGYLEIFREVFGSRTERLRKITYTLQASGQQPGWTHMSISIPSYWTDYALSLVAVTGGDSSAPPLAVDDISLKAGYCQ